MSESHGMGESHGVSIREANERDDPAIGRLVADAGMGELTERGTCYVAVQDERVVGFVRIVEAERRWYVNPIVVDARERRGGVGRALMDDARARYGELLFVARGHAVPFYEAIGCDRVPWSEISPDLGEDCDSCPDVEACSPVPMIYR